MSLHHDHVWLESLERFHTIQTIFWHLDSKRGWFLLQKSTMMWKRLLCIRCCDICDIVMHGRYKIYAIVYVYKLELRLTLMCIVEILR